MSIKILKEKLDVTQEIRTLHHHRVKWRLYLERSPFGRVLLITRILGDLNPFYIRFEIGNDGTPEGRSTVDQSGHILRKVLVDVRLMRETLCSIVSRFSVFESSVYVISGSRCALQAHSSAPRIESGEDQGI